MKIVQLSVENIKRISAVTITPDGAMVQISGKNGAGKTSILDSIAYAIGGKDLVCEQPVREGQPKAKIVCELDDLIITRTFTAAGGGSLTVTNKEGEKYPSPQAVLDKLVGKLAFDPLSFSRMPPKQQAETLRGLVGLDFSGIDAQRKTAYDERTLQNNTVKLLESQLAGIPEHGGVPAKEVSVAELAQSLGDANKANEEYRLCKDYCDSVSATVETVTTEIVRLEKALEAARADLTRRNAELEESRAELAKLKTIDVRPIQHQMSTAEKTNRAVRDNLRRAEIAQRLTIARKEAESRTAAIEELDAAKKQQLEDAKFPVPGLSFDETGVRFNDIPFTQASAAEQLRVSVAMGLAMNPTLRVLLIRDGSLLDDNGLKMIAEAAEKADAQVWIEKVSNGEKVGIVIEDGALAK